MARSKRLLLSHKRYLNATFFSFRGQQNDPHAFHRSRILFGGKRSVPRDPVSKLKHIHFTTLTQLMLVSDNLAGPRFSSCLFYRADYWISQGRKFCTVCKCWFTDNKAVSYFGQHYTLMVVNCITQVLRMVEISVRNTTRQRACYSPLLHLIFYAHLSLPNRASTSTRVGSGTRRVSGRTLKMYANLPLSVDCHDGGEGFSLFIPLPAHSVRVV